MPNLTMSTGVIVMKPDLYIYYILASYILLVTLCGTLENLCVIVVFHRCKVLWSPSNIYILDLATSDMLISFLGGSTLTISCYKTQWVLAPVGCSAYAFLMSITGLHSIHIMMVIAIGRYKAISEPFRTAKVFTKKRAFMMVAITWFVAIISSLPPLFGWNRYVLEGLQISCGFDTFDRSWTNKSYIICLLVGDFLIPVTIIAVCYGTIFTEVRRHTATMTVMNKSTMSSKTDKDFHTQVKLVKMGLKVTVSFVVAWGPYALVSLLSLCDVITIERSLLVVSLSGFFAKSFTVYNPIIYIYSYPRFKKELFNLLNIHMTTDIRRQDTTRTMESIRVNSQSCKYLEVDPKMNGKRTSQIPSINTDPIEDTTVPKNIPSQKNGRKDSNKVDVYYLRVTEL